jgi:type II secretory pathway component PulM
VWFDNLQPRERWIVLGGAVAALVILLWALVLRPLGAQSVTLREAVDMKQRLLIDLARLEGTQVPASPNVQGGDQTLVVIVNNTAQSHGLTLSRTRPNGPNGIDVTFQGASFDVLAAWLITLHGSYAVDVESASLTSARVQGLVNGQLSLNRL